MAEEVMQEGWKCPVCCCGNAPFALACDFCSRHNPGDMFKPRIVPYSYEGHLEELAAAAWETIGDEVVYISCMHQCKTCSKLSAEPHRLAEVYCNKPPISKIKATIRKTIRKMLER